MPTAYDTDFYTWTQEQAALLREGTVTALDLHNLAEEIASLGAGDWRALESCLRIILLHLLKWRYQPQRRQTSPRWYRSIVEHRARVAGQLRDSPSLKPHVAAMLAEAYPRARRIASHETRLPVEVFPVACPWSVTQVLDDDFFPH